MIRLAAVSLVISAIALLTLVIPPATSWAADYPGNQAINQPATLVGPEPDTPIAIYPKPATRPGPVGYGISGDGVTVIEQVGSNQGITWDAVRFDNPPYAEGWVQAEFVSMPTAASQSNPSQQNPAQRDRYLGNQPSRSNPPGQSQSYAQQKQY